MVDIDNKGQIHKFFNKWANEIALRTDIAERINDDAINEQMIKINNNITVGKPEIYGATIFNKTAHTVKCSMEKSFKEPEILILDTKELIENYESNMCGIGEIDSFEMHEIITQTIQTALNSNSPIMETGSEVVDYSRLIPKSIDNSTEIREVNNILTKGIIEKLKEQGALATKEFNYFFDSMLGKDVVLRKLPY